MMTTLKRSYYVSLLSAAELHGASHQAPQAFQVMCNPPLSNRQFARVRLRFYSGSHIRSSAHTSHKVPTGTMRVATREQTVVDMVANPSEAGGLGNIATVLRDIGPLQGQALATLAIRRNRTLTRRVGWMVEQFGNYDDLQALHQAAAPLLSEPVLLQIGAARRGPVDSTWGLRINSEVEPD
jgi:predicted transcriptional regulator of viral defense system